jgi:ankyrin repeat protein
MSNVELLKLLLARNPKSTLNMSFQWNWRDHGTPLYIAAMHGNQEVVDLLLDTGADPNSRGKLFGDALQASATLGHEQVVQKLLQHGADPTTIHGSFGTAHLAALHSSCSNDTNRQPADEKRKIICRPSRAQIRSAYQPGFCMEARGRGRIRTYIKGRHTLGGCFRPV